MAGIAVAKTGYFAGVAPEATLGTYRVFGCEGPTSTSLVLQAIRTAVNDQMQIIVLPEIPFVGGARQDYHLSHWFEEKTTQRRIEFASSCLNMKYDFGDIALIWYKKAEMPTVLERAKAAKMAGLIIVNGPYKERQNCEIPLFDISTDDALFIEEGYKDNRGYKYIFAEKYGYIEDGSATVDTTARHNQPFMPPFYPDILAPSHRLFTGMVHEKMNQFHFTDISAAVAYVAGAAALIANVYDKRLINVEYVKTILQNSAVPVKVSNTDVYAPTSHQGAGMINFNRLMNPERIHVFPSLIDMRDNVRLLKTTIRASPVATTSLSYKISHIPNVSILRTPHTNNISLNPSILAVVSLPGSINLYPNQISEFDVTISTPENIAKDKTWSYSGYIVLDPNPRFNKPPSGRAVFIPYYGTVRG
ncbi:hypothetical protein BDF19DRAFT_420236 [Syncephalis fuscata]|nr:hypothetical protein BDF19DRAFT_420236 [Syncephalis fuscata]